MNIMDVHIRCLKRRELDILKLLYTGFEIQRADEKSNQIVVTLEGPQNTLYEGGEWKVLVLFPNEYPYKSPSVGFQTKIYHPNIDFHSGSVCLDVLNQAWAPLYDLKNIFESFLPQLLTYPNSKDPLNVEAGFLFEKNPELFKGKVLLAIQLYALPQASKSVVKN